MIVLALAIIIAMPLQAQDKECPSESGCAVGRKFKRDLAESERALNTAEAALRTTLHDEKVTERRSIEPEIILAIDHILRAWRPMMEAECGVYGAVTGGSGDWKYAYQIDCEDWTVSDRAKLLSSITACLRRPPAPSAESEKTMECFYPLTPSIAPSVYRELG